MSEPDYCVRCGAWRKDFEETGILALCWAPGRSDYYRRHRWASAAAKTEEKRLARDRAKLAAWERTLANATRRATG